MANRFFFSIDPDNSNPRYLEYTAFRFPSEFELAGFYCPLVTIY